MITRSKFGVGLNLSLPKCQSHSLQPVIDIRPQNRRCLFTLHGHLDYIRTVHFHHEMPWIVSLEVNNHKLLLASQNALDLCFRRPNCPHLEQHFPSMHRRTHRAYPLCHVSSIPPQGGPYSLRFNGPNHPGVGHFRIAERFSSLR